ncbi:hypothetical protein E2C01_011473 [Portunus trituberculatus]|uniref:Uncharacterized protein n=1 Tax=Portunus trituberculatus TaxID=210409 RepID=A0A5B7DB64_PORTR|nr:hypothetical protein [Portunus trituberculatus]
MQSQLFFYHFLCFKAGHPARPGVLGLCWRIVSFYNAGNAGAIRVRGGCGRCLAPPSAPPPAASFLIVRSSLLHFRWTHRYTSLKQTRLSSWWRECSTPAGRPALYVHGESSCTRRLRLHLTLPPRHAHHHRSLLTCFLLPSSQQYYLLYIISSDKPSLQNSLSPACFPKTLAA